MFFFFRKKLKATICKCFNLSDELLEEFLHQKVLTQLKVITCTNDIVKIYCAADVAIVFYFKGKFYPTLFLVWTFCNILPRLKLDKCGKSKLKSSTELTISDLTSVNNNYVLSSLSVDQSISLCTDTCQKVIAIGYLTMDGKAIQNHETNQDICLKVLHYHEDELFKTHIFKIIPHIIPVLERECHNDREYNEDITNPNRVEVVETTTEKMNILLTQCSLKALKYSIKKEMLPILASTFYKKYVMSFCPEGVDLDIKKTSYKRLSTFLQLLDEDGLIKFNAGRNGIAEITRVIETSSKFQDVNLDDNPELKENVDEFLPPVKEIYVVTPGLHPIFSEFLCRYVHFFQLVNATHTFIVFV